MINIPFLHIVITLVRGRVFAVEGANPLDKRLHTAFLEDTHKRRLESLTGIRRHLGNGGLGPGALLDVAAGDLLELKVSGNVGGDEDVGELARGHEELGDEVDVPFVKPAVRLPRLLAFAVVSILFEELFSPRSEVGRGTGSRTEVGRFYRLEVYGGGLSREEQLD